MDSVADENYRSIKFRSKFDSGHDSDDDFDLSDVVIRNPRHSSSFLLADEGDGAEADLLGTTPPRSRIRNKEAKRNTDQHSQKQALRVKRVGSDSILKSESMSQTAPDRLKKRASLKLYRSRERDIKQDMSQREQRPETLPSPGAGPAPAVPTLVESCSRFMSLTSKLKCREEAAQFEEQQQEDEVQRRRCPEVAAPPSRVNFHKTFSLLINMGNLDNKSCRRTISREEQVWQNELKDLIWLELQAKIAGRSLAQQDEYLCAQRNVVPAVVQNIIDYRFVNPSPCRARSQRLCVASSREDLASEPDTKEEGTPEDAEDDGTGCLMFNCRCCTDAVGAAMREVNALLDSYYNAVALYPSSKAMTGDHPLVATQLFQDRIKAMCLWYNTALHMRLKMLAVRRMMRTLRNKRRRARDPPASLDALSRQSSEVSVTRPCLVRFNCKNPTDSSNSESSTHSKEEGSEVTSEDSAGEKRDFAKEEEEKGDAEGNEEKGQDQPDCALYRCESSETNGQATPEIVVSDQYGTSESTESGYTSASSMDTPRSAGVYDMGSLDDITRLRLLGKCTMSPYREYHYEMLKTHGVRRCMMFVNKMCSHVLYKVHVTLEKPDSVKPEGYQEDGSVKVFDDARDEDDADDKKDEFSDAAELRRYGCWSDECISMRLPSYRNHFLTLSSICMEIVHDYLSLRLEARPERPSCLTVKQLIHELKEGLDISTVMRRDFVRNVEVSLKDRPAPAAARRDLRLMLRTYDATVESVLKQYLSYLTTMSETEVLSRASLQAEWAFTARLAKRVRCAAALAPLTFSDIACNQINRLLMDFERKFADMMEKKNFSDKEFRVPNRYTAYMMCRTVQDIYSSWREPLLHTAQWARALAARLARAQPPAFAAQREAILDKLLSMREFLFQHTVLVLDKTSVPDEELELTEGLVTRVRVLLLQMFKLGFELHKELFKLVAPYHRVDERGSLRSRPASLQSLRPAVQPGPRRRPETVIVHDAYNPAMHKELHRVVNDVRRSAVSMKRPVVNSPPRPAGPCAGPGRVKFMRSESINEETVFDDRLFDTLNYYRQSYLYTQTPIERLLADEEPEDTVQYRHQPVPEAEEFADSEQKWAAKVARAIIQFARCWMQFVVKRCDRGRGLRPRWASQGLEFLMLACDPCNTKHLTEDEFEELKTLMDGCISHVVGSRPATRTPDCGLPRTKVRLHSPSPGGQSPHSPPQSAGPPPPPPTPPAEPDLSYHPNEIQSHSKRVQEAVRRIEETRDEKLREMKSVGRVMDQCVTSYEPKLRQLTFKWQRGLKIGAGTFGKVYTVVNTESGQLLAMKELNIGAGDRRALQRAANELRVLEGVIHPHLVRYYGCELHREEMLIFMELCVEGSLEALVATSGALAEQTTRRYAKQLLSAVTELHARNIAHRDIKSGNIFLTNEGHCLKLGDFGCAVKIRANTTAPGELQGFVGTQAYMAPEVFMKSSGHGRAADIWSFGCVVTEMASGKRPFSEYDSNYQIMFVVGMGGRPDVPDSLSEEGRDFCLRCLTHDPDSRARADQLQLHHFLMVKSDDDCKCEPSFLIT